MSSPTSEIEIVFYARVGNAAQLASADVIEEHVQLEGRMLEDGVKTRVRKVTAIKGDKSEYIFTVKRKNAKPVVEGDQDKMQNSTEWNCPVTEEFFETFKQAAEQCLIKTRYHFKNRLIHLRIGGRDEPVSIPDVGFEVDVFKSGDHVVDYVKVDVEVDAIIKYMNENHPDLKDFNVKIKLPGLAWKPIDTIYPPTATEEQKQLVKNLWENEYTMKRDKFLNL